MMPFLRQPALRIVAGAGLLTLILAWMVVDRVMVLARGREIVLPIRPVDPRDLFKGDYARLAFDISQLDPALFPARPGAKPGAAASSRAFRAPRTVYVTLEQQADMSWKPVAVTDNLPQGLPSNRIALKGRTHGWNDRFVTYGLERYFVPEGTGGAIEEMARKSQLSAIVAVDGAGRAAIKGLVHEGRRVYEEPLL